MLIYEMNEYFKEFVLPIILKDDFDYFDFLDYDEFNYDYSINEIEQASGYLKYLIVKYLLENYDGEYLIYENEGIRIWKNNIAKEKLGNYYHDDEVINKENFKDYLINNEEYYCKYE